MKNSLGRWTVNEIPKRFPDGEVKGLYGDAMLFLAYGKARHSRTYQRLLNRTNADKEIPLKLTYEERSDFRKSTPLLIYTIPLATKQMSMFTSLKRGLLQNLSGHDGLSMFNYGHFEFITFLHPVAYFTMTCKVDPEKRDNLGKRRNAYLFNKLFDVDVLRNTRIHLGCDHFSPKLEQYPWTKPEMFGTIPAPIIAVSIRSRSAIRIGGYPVMNDAEDNSETAVLSTNELLKFCFLISEVALKENAKRTAEELFGILCGDKGRAVAKGLDLTKVSTVPNEALEEAFIELRSELQVPIDWKVTETML
ncbi:unnamed protein product, partial [Mesorhabditis belari]|uniref:Uncharacterized protein n=1 Tax=Mesorhabditis belari TaxID=2138241 RepID=A0AAF3F3J4_9BILA